MIIRTKSMVDISHKSMFWMKTRHAYVAYVTSDKSEDGMNAMEFARANGQPSTMQMAVVIHVTTDMDSREILTAEATSGLHAIGLTDENLGEFTFIQGEKSRRVDSHGITMVLGSRYEGMRAMVEPHSKRFTYQETWGKLDLRDIVAFERLWDMIPGFALRAPKVNPPFMEMEAMKMTGKSFETGPIE